jgi:hypothetical protein
VNKSAQSYARETLTRRFVMKKLIGLFVFAMALSVGTASLSWAAGDKAASGPQAVKGDLLKIEGDAYVVKDMAGKETRLHVDETTKLDGSFKTGDKVEAQVTDKSHALSMTHANPVN